MSASNRIIVPALKHQEQNTLDVLLGRLGAKAPRNLMRAAYYDGKNAVRDIGISTPPQMHRIATVLGWSAKAVDILNRRCKLETFRLDTADGDSLGLEQVWRDNWLGAESDQAGISSLIHATAFLVTTQGDTAAGEPAALITAKDALSGTGLWDKRRRVLSNFLSVIDTDDDGKPTEFVLYLPNQNVFASKSGAGWKVERRDHVYGVPVEPLTYQPRLGREFGKSRISRPVMALQDAAIRSVIRSEVQAEIYNVPQRVLLGASESAFTNADGTMRSMWQAVLGKVWAIERDEDDNVPDIKEFSAASQQPHMEQLRSFAQLFAGETSIPIASLGISGDANPTSEGAYESGRADIVSEAEGTQDGWRLPWERTMLNALAMYNKWGQDVPDEVRYGLRAKFRDPRFISRAASADATVKLVQAGILPADSDVTLEQVGLDPESIKRVVADRRRSSVSQLVAGLGARLDAAESDPAIQAVAAERGAGDA